MTRQSTSSTDYFSNHGRRDRFPWSLYHRPLARPLARAIAAYGPSARVLIVGCGLEVDVPGAPPGTVFHGCDVDPRAIDECRRRRPREAARFAVCPGPYELPTEGEFGHPFNVILAKEVIEHVLEPERWAQTLTARLAPGGTMVLTTPNYGRLSTLPLIENTILELFAWRDGFSRREIHPTKFDRARLRALDVGAGMKLVSVAGTLSGWTLIGSWQRVAA